MTQLPTLGYGHEKDTYNLVHAISEDDMEAPLMAVRYCAELTAT